MAKSKAYQVTEAGRELWWAGKSAVAGDVVTDLPGESISWLLADGLITPYDGTPPVDTPADPTPAEPTPAEPAPADTPVDEGAGN